MGGVAWTEEEDQLLKKCIQQYGEGRWHRIPHLSGLRRCRKSCRLRWVNYLRPNINRGRFSQEEDEIIVKLRKLLGNRWSLIAAKLPGRTANDVKNYWNCHLRKKIESESEAEARLYVGSSSRSAKQMREVQEVESPPVSKAVNEFETENEKTSLNASIDEEGNTNVELEQVKAICREEYGCNIWEWDDLVLEDIDLYNASF